MVYVFQLHVTITKNPGLGFSIAGGNEAQGNPYRPDDNVSDRDYPLRSCLSNTTFSTCVNTAVTVTLPSVTVYKKLVTLVIFCYLSYHVCHWHLKSYSLNTY